MAEQTTAAEQGQSRLAGQLLNEPTVHFFIIAIAIFALFAWSNRNNENLLEIDQRELDARIFMQELSAGEALTEEQRTFITNSFVEEQILVREALALGLDNDARIHDLLAQKMRHVLSGDIIQASQEELQAYYDRNQARYRSPELVDLEELVFDSRVPLPEDIAAMLAAGASSEELTAVEDGNFAPLNRVSELDLRNIFDPEYATRVFAADNESWTGPFVSNRGQHWLKILNRSPSRLPPLEEIIDRVRLEWVTEEEEARLQVEIQKLWDQYTIRIVDGDDEE